MTQNFSDYIVEGNAVFKFFTNDWDDLVRINPRATVFQTSGWYKAWIQAAADYESSEPVIIHIPFNGYSRFAVALQINHAGNKTICPLSFPWADYHDGVGSPFDDEAIKLISQILLEFVNKQQCPLVLNDVVPGGIWERILSYLPVVESQSTYTSGINLTDHTHLEKTFNKKEHVVKQRRLERLGKVRCRHHFELNAILKRFPAFVKMHSEQWKDRSDAVAPFDGEVINTTFDSIIRYLAPRGLILLTELLLDDRPVAMYYGFIYGCRYGAYRTTFDNTFRHLSPGHLMLRQMMVDFSLAGILELDLMRGNYSYKHEYLNYSGYNKRFELFVD